MPSHYRWVAATSGSQTAASLELATGGDPVMAIGGFNNEGGNLSLAQFEAVRQGGRHPLLHRLGGGAGGGPGGPAAARAERDHELGQGALHVETIGGQTVYDLTQAKG